jgi:hypothetical protein
MFVDFNIINQLGSPSINSNTLANRPAAGQRGRLFVSTDTFELYRDNGTGWDLIGGPGSSTVVGTGAAGQVAYWTGTNTIAGNNNLFWDAANERLGVGTTTPESKVDIAGNNTLLHLKGGSNAYMMYHANGVNEYKVGYTGGAMGFRRWSIYDESGTKEVITIDKISRRVGVNYQYANALDIPDTTFGVAGSFKATATIQGDLSITAKLTTSSSIPSGYAGFYASSGTNSINFVNGTSGDAFWFLFPTGTSQLTIPNNSGTIALLSDIPSLAGYVPTTRTITINGTSQDLSANRTYSVGTVTSVGTSGPITGGTITGSGTIGITQSSSLADGYLSSTDWTTFNNKQSAITLTTTGSSGASTLVGATLNIPNYTLAGLGGVPTSRSITINGTSQDLSADRSYSVGTVTSITASSPLTGGTITGSGTIGIQQATTFLSGFLSSTDWNTFNNKQNAITLTTTGSSGAATFVSGTLNIPNYTLAGLGGVPTSRTITINGTSQDLSANRSYSVGTVTSVATSGPLTGGTITGSGTIGITQSSSLADGYLSSTDWNTFNGKLSGTVSPNRFAVGTFPVGVVSGNISQNSISGAVIINNTVGTLQDLRSNTYQSDDVFYGFPTGSNVGAGKIKFSQVQFVGGSPVLYVNIDGTSYGINLF